ncbi:hypothetical protein AB0M83_02455 [Amycolatopsis sp. NPDC051106]|uniref:hypothetical protein n=1 Tax=unclassified Amycolatopsis TaxID=2618356 RepID=UPI003416E787
MAPKDKRTFGIWVYVAIYGLLPVTFLILLITGLYGDSKGFWSSRPFLTNIWTTATGACVGIPVAVGLLQKVAAAQADKAQWRITRRTLQVSVSELTESFKSLLTYSSEHDILEFRGKLAYSMKRFETLTELPMNPKLQELFDYDGTRPDITHEKYRSYISDEVDLLVNDLLACRQVAVRMFAPAEQSRQYQDVIYSRWEDLETRIRPRVLEAGRRWISDALRHQIASTRSMHFDREGIVQRIDKLISDAKTQLGHPSYGIHQLRMDTGHVSFMELLDSELPAAVTMIRSVRQLEAFCRSME